MSRQRAALEEAGEAAELGGLIAGLRQASLELASPRNQQSSGVATQPAKEDPQRAA
jgi:hypothetical protein